jgi:non-heme chloroperoxidase
MLTGDKDSLDCVGAFSKTAFADDLQRFDVPTLIVHGDDDQIVPIGAAALRSPMLVRKATLRVYAGMSQGLADTLQGRLTADLLALLQT